MAANGAITGRYYLGLNSMKKILNIMMAVLLIMSTASANGLQENPAKLKINKAMLKNFFKSLIIPGWGQYENGNKVRGILYVTAELAGIYAYQSNYAAGEDKEVAFKAFGDEHWYYGRWSPHNDGETACGGNLRTHQMPTRTDADGVDLYDSNGFLIPLKDQHFYENISKYPEFVCGWDDIGELYDVEYTPNKLTYIEMRTRSNELYRNAQMSGTLIMLNHLISAFDAALGTDMTSFESSSFTGKLYINPLNVARGISMEVTF